MSIRSRLAATYGAGVILTLVIVGVFVWWQLGVALRGSLETTLQTRAAGVITSLENGGQAGLQETDHAAPGVFAALFSGSGSLVDATTDAPTGLQPVNGVFDIGGRRYLLKTQVAPDGTTILTGADLQGITDAQAALARLLIGIGFSVGAASLFGGWLLAGRALKPIDRLIDDAASLGPGNMRRRLAAPPRMDEVGRLAVTLNGMLDRIADSVEQQRLFVAMASHELRTPLAALRAELDIVERDEATIGEYRDALQEAQGDAIRLTSLASSLLALAVTQEDAQALSRTAVGLRGLVSSVVRGIDPLARRNHVVVDLDVSDEVVWVDRTRLEQALGNLLENAVTYGGQGDKVQVRGRIVGKPGERTLKVEVLDRGPGIGGDAPEGLFAPFRRGTQVGAPGSGLGLATVAGVVRAHEGTFGASNREGGGAVFWFELPCDRSKTDEVDIIRSSGLGRQQDARGRPA